MQPRFPPEIEQYVFEVAARRSKRQIPSLMLVARRVKGWVEPILYQVVIKGPESAFKSDLRRRRTLGRHVRSLCLLHEEYIDHLTFCPNIQNLALWFTPSQPTQAIHTLLSMLTLRRLSVYFHTLYPQFKTKHPDFKHRMFAHITHLEILDSDEDWPDSLVLESLAHMPSLTHLAFDGERSQELCQRIFRRCNRLQVLVVLGIRSDMARSLVLGDPRVVLGASDVWIEDWERGALGGKDFWKRSESELIARFANLRLK
ncbi:hypothetical protein AX16_002144 [Volvariella volvacea WC 439]|nr:hypothetical protein AX16_002144 [Volvariella volvacea WC 439]